MPNLPRRRAPNFINVPAGFRTWEAFKLTAKRTETNAFGQARMNRPERVSRNAYLDKPENFELYAFGTSTAGTCSAFVDKIRALNFEVFFGNNPQQANYAMVVLVVARNQTTCDWRRLFCLFENVEESQAVGVNAMNFFWDN